MQFETERRIFSLLFTNLTKLLCFISFHLLFQKQSNKITDKKEAPQILLLES